MKEIKGFENYSIDEKGNVFNNKNKQIKPSLNNKGYLRLSLRKNKIKYYFSVHRLVALNYLINSNNYPQVNHIDGNKTNNHYSNLEWCTNKQNIRHAIENNLADYSKNVKSRYNKL